MSCEIEKMPALKEPLYLMPCPFCGCELDARWNRPNPYARCLTVDCQGAKMPLLCLDVPEDIARWNSRVTPFSMAQNRHEQLTDQQIDAIIAAMPNGMDGFLKSWGFRQFAPRLPRTEEQIKSIDDRTHFHESPDWPLRFARAIEAAHDIVKPEK